MTPEMQPSSFTYNTLIRGLCRMATEAEAEAEAEALASAAARDVGAVEDSPPSARREAGAVENREQGQRQEDQDMGVGGGVYTDRDLLLPAAAAGAAEGDPASIKGASGEDGDERERDRQRAAATGGSPPGILTDSADGGGSGSGRGNALPDGIQEALRVSFACAACVNVTTSGTNPFCLSCGDGVVPYSSGCGRSRFLVSFGTFTVDSVFVFLRGVHLFM